MRLHRVWTIPGLSATVASGQRLQKTEVSAVGQEPPKTCVTNHPFGASRNNFWEWLSQRPQHNICKAHMGFPATNNGCRVQGIDTRALRRRQ